MRSNVMQTRPNVRLSLWVLLAIAPTTASAQVGRLFGSAEAYVGLSRIVHVGRIVELDRIKYEQPLNATQKLGQPYRLLFEIDETIRGADAESLELVLSLQSTIYLEYLRDHSIEVLLLGGPNRIDSFPGARVGIEEQGKRVDGDKYQFRILDPLEVPEQEPENAIVSQLNRNFDSGRMFTSGLEVIEGREAILQRMRAFDAMHPMVLQGLSLRVPNEFGALCGAPNAFCAITLPHCPETKATLTAVQDDPGLILKRIESGNEKYNRALLRSEVEKALAMFPDDDQ